MFDYTKVTSGGISTDIDRALATADEMVTGVVDPDTPRTYATVMQPLDDISDILQQGLRRDRLHGLRPCRTRTSEMPGNQAEEKIQKWGVELVFRPDLYRAVKDFSESPEAAALEGEQARFLQFWLRDLRRAGHELDETSRAEVKKLTERMVEVGIAFQRNIDEHKDHLVVTKEDLEGFPIPISKTWNVATTMTRTTSGCPIRTWSPLWRTPRAAICGSNSFANSTVARWNPIALSWKRRWGPASKIAGLFGQASWAHHQMEEKMAKTPEAVRVFLRRPDSRA